MQVRKVRVQIETTRQRIVGTIRLPTEGYRSRTTDFLNAQGTGFIAVTDAQVMGDETVPQRHDYIAVGCRHIVAAAELEDLGPEEEADAGPTVASLGSVSVPPPADGA